MTNYDAYHSVAKVDSTDVAENKYVAESMGRGENEFGEKYFEYACDGAVASERGDSPVSLTALAVAVGHTDPLIIG